VCSREQGPYKEDMEDRGEGQLNERLMTRREHVSRRYACVTELILTDPGSSLKLRRNPEPRFRS
jgi:hypothetical protein